MKNIFKHLILASIVSICLLVTPLTAVHAAVLGDPTACDGANLAGVGVNCADGQFANQDNGFGPTIRAILNVLSVVVGVAAVIMIIVGGFRYVISGGDSNGVSGAKNTILYAIIGLVVVIFAQVIVRFVLSTQSGVAHCTVPGKTSLLAKDPNCKP